MPLGSNLSQALAIAQELIKYLPEIRESLEALAELRRRQGRVAQAGDLDDSVARLKALERP